MYEKVTTLFRRAQKHHYPKPTSLPEAAILGLKPHQLYPERDKLRADFFKRVRLELLTKQTPIASMGSCFAREVKDYLVTNGYNYVQTATGPNARHGSAAWDRVYNTFCIGQEFERALGTFSPAEPYWKKGSELVDPYRKAVRWPGPEAMEAELAEHKRTAALALTTAEIVVLTIGVNEIWYAIEDGAVFFQVPPAGVFDPKRHAFRLATVEENFANLQRAHELLRQANPTAKMIVTVSPVPLRATFRDDADAVSATAESKATLLVATREFVRQSEDVYYFPSYEIALNTTPEPFEVDARHVKREVVTQIMEVFDYQFIK
jgi:hypothetical protein